VLAGRGPLANATSRGETAAQARETCQTLAADGIGSILNYAVEFDDSPEPESGQSFDLAAAASLESLETVATLGPNGFIAVKATALCPYATLQRVSAVFNSASSAQISLNDLPISQSDKVEIDRFIDRLLTIVSRARQLNVKILLDAEKWECQQAIDSAYATVAPAVNPSSGPPVLFNTVQMYTKSSPERLRGFLMSSKEEGYSTGFKLVRGAYLAWERSGMVPDPIWKTKEETDAAFDDGSMLVLDAALQAIAEGRGREVHLMVASHNAGSSRRVATRLLIEGSESLSRCVTFAQLFGVFRPALPGYRVYDQKDNVIDPLFQNRDERPAELRIAGHGCRECVQICALRPRSICHAVSHPSSAREPWCTRKLGR
jgi:proline dehydrogenase